MGLRSLVPSYSALLTNLWWRLRGILDDDIPRIASPPCGEGAPKGRIGHRRHEREREGASQVDDLRKHPIHRSAVPLPHAGNAVKLSKILIAHASNSVCFFHALSLQVNNKIKKLVK